MSGAGKKRSRIYNFEKGDYIFTKDWKKTKWRYIKDLPYLHRKRNVLVLCDCGSIESRYLVAIVSGRSLGCMKCSTKSRSDNGSYPGSMRWYSKKINKGVNYFSAMRSKNPLRFYRIKKLGNGDLAKGWLLEQSPL